MITTIEKMFSIKICMKKMKLALLCFKMYGKNEIGLAMFQDVWQKLNLSWYATENSLLEEKEQTVLEDCD